MTVEGEMVVDYLRRAIEIEDARLGLNLLLEGLRSFPENREFSKTLVILRHSLCRRSSWVMLWSLSVCEAGPSIGPYLRPLKS